MNIQIIDYYAEPVSYTRNEYLVSTVGSPKSLDEYDTNIIDLSSAELWRYNGIKIESINMISDIMNLGVMIKKSKNSRFLIIIPRDLSIEYDHHRRHARLKNNLTWAESTVIRTLIPSSMYKVWLALRYENTTTNINGFSYDASFYFADHELEPILPDSILTKSKGSEKYTSLKMDDRLILTTINVLQSEDHLMNFLSECNWIANEHTYPDWLIDYHILDDERHKNLISEQERCIDQARQKISTSNDKIKDNLEIKSILYTNGKALETTVFKLLEKLLDTDLSEFEDNKKEDFLIKIDEELEFIGEIKGRTSNIKSEHVSQLDVHYQKYLDCLASENKSINVKALLIINPLKNTPVEDREPVNHEQIKLATRNEALIIETVNLLYLYEKFVLGEVDSTSCRGIFKTKIGILTKDDIDRLCEI